MGRRVWSVGSETLIYSQNNRRSPKNQPSETSETGFLRERLLAKAQGDR
ncbi:MAG: hypothetical protein ACAF41_06185 [Leptolyngbya sp. BL-A-14]